MIMVPIQNVYLPNELSLVETISGVFFNSCVTARDGYTEHFWDFNRRRHFLAKLSTNSALIVLRALSFQLEWYSKIMNLAGIQFAYPGYKPNSLSWSIILAGTITPWGWSTLSWSKAWQENVYAGWNLKSVLHIRVYLQSMPSDLIRMEWFYARKWSVSVFILHWQ